MLNVALKEWDLVISAILEGRQAVLLRKGAFKPKTNSCSNINSFTSIPPSSIRIRAWSNGRSRGDRHARIEPDRIEIRGCGAVDASSKSLAGRNWKRSTIFICGTPRCWTCALPIVLRSRSIWS